MSKVHSIQSLRAIAALAVVLFHVVGQSFVIGAAGVDIFFVISGLIMGFVATKIPPGTFLYHRLVRIVPMYWAITIVMCLGAVLGVFSTFSFTFDQLIKSLLFIPYANSAGSIEPLLVVGWTLNIEMFFYLVFAVGLTFRAPLIVTSIILSVMVLLGQRYAWQAPMMQLWTSPLLLEFLLGLLLSRFAALGLRWGYASLALGGIGFVVASFVAEQSGLLRVIYWGMPAFMLVAGCLWIEAVGQWPEALLRPLEVVGDASYVLYLIHGLVISIVHKVLAPSVGSGVAIVFLAIAISLVIHFFFEKPLIKVLRRYERPRNELRA